MKQLPVIFFGIFLTLAFSFTGIVLGSYLQLGDIKPVATEDGQLPQPMQKVGAAQQGREVYTDLGCVYCHSQQVRRKGYGADWERGWGNRQTVPRDYIYEPRVMLGTSRTGPDLMTIGQRQPSADWHHLHLYNPQITSPGSLMPPFGYLYRLEKIQGEPSPDALSIPDSHPESQPPPGYQIVPGPRAKALVAYLQSLKLNYELPEAKFSE